jgi:hypothetical protein
MAKADVIEVEQLAGRGRLHVSFLRKSQDVFQPHRDDFGYAQQIIIQGVRMTSQELQKMIDEMCNDKPTEFRRILAIFLNMGAKRCPFCGEKAHLHYSSQRDFGHDGWATLGCHTADCRGNIPMVVPPSKDFEKEIARWNRRSKNSSSK